MDAIIRLNKKLCGLIIQNDEYLATIGHSVTVYQKTDFSQVAVFAGMRDLIDGWFLDGTTIIVVSTSNRFYSLSIENKACTWSLKDFPSGRFISGEYALNPLRQEIYGIVSKNPSARCQALVIRPGEGTCHNVTLPIKPSLALKSTIVNIEDGSFTFMHSGNFGGDCFTRLWRGCPPYDTPFELIWERRYNPANPGPVPFFHHSEKYIAGAYGGKYFNCPVCLEWIERATGESHVLELPEHFYHSFPGRVRWTPDQKYLLVASSDYFLVLELPSGMAVARYAGKYVTCGAVVNDKFILGTAEGVYVYPFPHWAEWGKPKVAGFRPGIF